MSLRCRSFSCLSKTQLVFGSTRSNWFSERTLIVPKKSWNTLVRGLRQQSRRSLAPVEEVQGPTKSFRDLGKPFAFTMLISGVSFAGCAVWQYESLRTNVYQAMKDGHAGVQHFYKKAGGLRGELNARWNTLSKGQKLVAGIIGINTAVFLMWKVVPLQMTMVKYFCSTPMSGAMCWSMLLSTFSHYAFFHLAANMYVLWSFAPTITSLLGREQFLALYLSAGMFSSLTSYIYKVARVSPIPSLGASGAIMAILGAVCSYYPDGRLSIAFVDQIFPHSFSAGSAMKCIIVFDTLGVLFGWRYFDHAAHLGGMLFGLWYINYGHKMIWQRREKFIKWWHELRGKP